MNRSRIAMAAVMVIGLSGAARAAVVSVDVSNNSGQGAYTGPGVLDTSNHAWLLRTASGGTFTLGGNTVTITYGSHSEGSSTTPAINLFDDYKFTTDTAIGFGFVLTGLDLTKTYDIVIYTNQNFSGLLRGALLDLQEGTYGGADPKTSTGDAGSAFVEGVNYLRYDNVAPSNINNDQRIRWLIKNAGEGAGFFNGFEIQEHVVIPAPAALPAGLAMLGLIAARRRR